MMTLPPLFKSEIVLNDISSPNRDCMNSFLKKAVKKNIAVSLNDAVLYGRRAASGGPNPRARPGRDGRIADMQGSALI